MKKEETGSSLSYVTRQMNHIHDVIITLHKSITSDDIISISMETASGLFLGNIKSIEELTKVYSKYARKYNIGKTLVKLDGQVIDLSMSIHTPAFEVNKICKGSIPKEMKDVK